MFQFFDIFLCIIQFFFEHFSHLFIGLFFQHGKAVLDGFFVFLVFCISVYDRLQITLFLHQLLKTFLVVCHARFSEFIQNFLETNQQVIKFIKHAVPPAFAFYQLPLCQVLQDLSLQRHRQSHSVS